MDHYGLPSRAALRVRDIFNCLTEASLDQPAGGPYEGLSFINADGLPFQWIQRLTADRDEWGFLCEVGRPNAAGNARRMLTLNLLRRCCVLANLAEPRFLNSAAASLHPVDEDQWPAHWRSATWVGVGIKGDAVLLKPYFNLNCGTARERWLRIGWLLKSSGRELALERLCQLSRQCAAGYWPVALAMDARADGELGRVKVYFRSEATTPASLARWYRETGLDFAAEPVRLLLDILGQTGSDLYPSGAFVVSLEIHADQSLSLKTDLAVTKWALGDLEIVAGTEVLAHRLRLPAQDLRERLQASATFPLEENRCAVSRFVGLGCEPDGEFHINFYHAPRIAPPTSPAPLRPRATSSRARRSSSDCSTKAVVEHGIKALFAARVCAHWKDFNLPVGISDQWVTAYVLTRLREVDRCVTLIGRQRAATEAALDWLEAARAPQAGWGYNGNTPNDADSTAWSILALRAWGRAVPPDALALLQSCMVNGGVSTYAPATGVRPGWSVACADVTAVATPALGECGLMEISIDRPSAAVLPRAYWWVSPLYVLAAPPYGSTRGVSPRSSRELSALLENFEFHGAFECALLLRLKRHHGLASHATAECLERLQCGSGLWPPSAQLRLVLSTATEPWRAIDSGPIHCDERGVFTAATALASLAGSVR